MRCGGGHYDEWPVGTARIKRPQGLYFNGLCDRQFVFQFDTQLSNAAVHFRMNAAVAKAMRDARGWFLFLPPYSPDLNPIEMAFSKLKAHLRRIGARTFTDMFDAIAEICDLYSPDECWNYFKAAGYTAG